MRPGDAGRTPCMRRETRAGSRRTQPDRSRAGQCLSVSNAIRARTDTSFETVWRIRVTRHLPNDGIPDPASVVVRAVQGKPRHRHDRSREQGIRCCRRERNACSFACMEKPPGARCAVRNTTRGHARRGSAATVRRAGCRRRHHPHGPTASRRGRRQLPGGVGPLTAAKPRVGAFRSAVVAWKSGVHRPALPSGSYPGLRCGTSSPRSKYRARSPLPHARWRKQTSARAGAGSRGWVVLKRAASGLSRAGPSAPLPPGAAGRGSPRRAA